MLALFRTPAWKKDAADCWIAAMELTEWDPGMNADRFIAQMTINAIVTLRTDQLAKRHVSRKDNQKSWSNWRAQAQSEKKRYAVYGEAGLGMRCL